MFIPRKEKPRYFSVLYPLLLLASVIYRIMKEQSISFFYLYREREKKRCYQGGGCCCFGSVMQDPLFNFLEKNQPGMLTKFTFSHFLAQTILKFDLKNLISFPDFEYSSKYFHVHSIKSCPPEENILL